MQRHFAGEKTVEEKEHGEKEDGEKDEKNRGREEG